MKNNKKTRVIFICIHNSARSQMAEELLRKKAGDRFDVTSAGLEPGRLNPFVVRVLKEDDIDISHKKTQSVDEILERGEEFDFIITVCDETSAERCPVFPGKGVRLHWSFPDPSRFEGTEEEILQQVRRVKQDISTRLDNWLREEL